jgi:anti-sigma regulatory factor (Ser/Thr protein kinase)/ABC-type transporter Mla MlaB component
LDGDRREVPAVLLSRQSEDDVEVLVLRGPVDGADAPVLHAALTDALETSSRGVVLDLTGTGDVDGAAVEALAEVAARAGSWPRPTLAVYGASAELRDRLEPGLAVHGDRTLALEHVDDRANGDRPDGARREVVVEHGPHGPKQARAAVQAWADDLGLQAVADDLLLIVSELVTNAVRYGKPPVCVAICADERQVTVGVVDAADERPRRQLPGADAESGRGLLLLSLLSSEHGVRPESPGKVVWACLPRT